MMFQLRWCFHYLDGKNKAGLWSNPGRLSVPETQAASQPTENLAAACIEGRCIRSQKVMVLANVVGQDFCQFQWVGCVPLSHGRHIPKIRGMVLVGRDIQFTVLETGRVTPGPRTWQDNIMKYGGAK